MYCIARLNIIDRIINKYSKLIPSPHCQQQTKSVSSTPMQIHLISVGNRMPDWVQQGYNEYAKRLPRECELVLKEIAPDKRRSGDIARITREEGERMLAALPARALVVTL